MKILNRTLFIFSLCLTLIVTSCEQKEILPINEDDFIDISMVEKVYQKKMAETKLPSSNLRGGNTRKSIKKTPIWKESFIRDISVGKAWIVPLQYEKKLGYFKSGLTLEQISYLMVYLSEEKVNFEIVTKLPNLEKQYDENGQWQGTVLVENLRGDLLKGYLWIDGCISLLNPLDPVSRSNLKAVMICQETEWYNCSWTDQTLPECSYDYTERSCAYESEPDDPETNDPQILTTTTITQMEQ